MKLSQAFGLFMTDQEAIGHSPYTLACALSK